jgi:hypothetical protein
MPGDLQSKTYELVFLAANVGNVHVVGGWTKFFELLTGEDINGNKMDLSVTVLAGLGGRHVDNLAGAVLDHNEAVLAELHQVSAYINNHNIWGLPTAEHCIGYVVDAKDSIY